MSYKHFMVGAESPPHMANPATRSFNLFEECPVEAFYRLTRAGVTG
jgi:hypothetical protein